MFVWFLEVHFWTLPIQGIYQRRFLLPLLYLFFIFYNETIYIYIYIIRRLQIFLLKCIFSKISKKYNCNIKGVQKQMKTLPVFFFPRMQPTSSVLVAFYIFFCLCRTNMKAITICLSQHISQNLQRPFKNVYKNSLRMLYNQYSRSTRELTRYTMYI